MSADRLARIAVDSLSIPERLATIPRLEIPGDQQTIQARLNEWRHAACEGDEALFRERLARDGLDLAAVHCLLGRIEVPQGFKLPEWTGLLNRVLEAIPQLRARALSPDAAGTFLYLKPADPLPFEELFIPFVEIARALFAEQRTSGLRADVLNTLARELLQKLADVAARVLAVEFRTFLASRQFGDDAEPVIESGSTASAEYRRFVARTYEQGWGPLLEEYCVMARLLAVAVTQWVSKVAEFEKRLVHDLPDIERAFNGERPLGAVVAARTGLSDPHDGGRTVIAVEFSSGLKLVYKPRSLGIEKAYFDFVAWINQCGALLPFRILKVLDRGGYGWVEHVEHRSCGSDDEIRRYYRRAGNLLCLVYALNGSDFHYENVIADRDNPVPIDLETIYHPRAEVAAGESDGADEIAARLRVSVLSTDLLPDPVKVDNQYFDISAFARSEQEEGEAEVVAWKHVNTDAMDYRYERQQPQPAHNLPRLNGAVAELNDYAKVLQNGFEQAYRFICERAGALLDMNGPLRAMFVHDARFIHRSTALYALVLRRALHPAYLSSGVDFGIQLELLARDLLGSRKKPATWPLLEAEMAALWRLDIPKFIVRGDDNTVKGGRSDPLARCLVDSAWSAAQAKIRGLNEGDLRWQLSLIAGALDVRIANLGVDSSATYASEEPEKLEPLSRDELLNVAMELANEIETKAFRLDSGGIGWMVLSYSPAAERYSLQPMGNDLYNGRAGVGLFFAALEKVMPSSRYRALAHASLKPIREWIERAADEDVVELGMGGYSGLPSIVYALTRAGELLGESELIADARVAALRLQPDQIENDKSLDTISGSAGAIPCLLACHAATGDPQVLATAVACGRHLLQAREVDKFGFRTWPTLDNCHLTGFSHGAAGIAYALLRLYKATAETDFYEAALEGIRFEGRAFASEHNNWPDYRRAAAKYHDPMFNMAWCHGAPGIGLGRIGALDIMNTVEVRRDIDAALASTGSVNLLPRDHLCCGNAGLMDTLCAAGERLSAGEWSRKGLQLAARTLRRRNTRGGFHIAFHNGFFNPSLLQGAAGVGYQMLRLADPTNIPSVLLLN